VPKDPEIQAPLRNIEAVAAELEAKAAKPRLVRGYKSVFKQLEGPITRMINQGYSLEEACDIIQKAFESFDREKFIKEFHSRARRGLTKGAGSNGKPKSGFVPIDPSNPELLKKV